MVNVFERLHNKECDLSHTRVFRCLCYNSTLTANRRKFDPRADIGVFLGFKINTKGYVVYNLKTHDIIASKNVVFYENVFPYSKHSNKINDRVKKSFPASQNYEDDLNIEEIDNTELNSKPNDVEPTFENTNSSDTYSSNNNLEHEHIQSDDRNNRNIRRRNPPSYLKDYHMFCTVSKNIRYPIENFISHDKLAPSFKCFICSIDLTKNLVPMRKLLKATISVWL